ncbi:PIG-L deacetylase family protein [Streptomyces sp. NPDC051452]|uniref:PIG-L deacetylase family protein n=1 Tax=Streptomyces sp. NPDC051452 TaxID=3365654 RepID=UPI0037896F8D
MADVTPAGAPGTAPGAGRRPAVLVVVAHPDDAEIAVGGTIAHLTARGVRVVTAVLSQPESGAGARQRTRFTERAAAVLGYELRWPTDGGNRQVTDIGEIALVAAVDRLIAEIAPQAVLTHWSGDGHADHRLAARAAAAATRTCRVDLYGMRPGETRTPAFSRFAPQVFVDISAHHAAKARALEPFGTARPGFRPLDLAAVEAADRFYGTLSGSERAEGLVVERAHGIGGLLSAR